MCFARRCCFLILYSKPAGPSERLESAKPDQKHGEGLSEHSLSKAVVAGRIAGREHQFVSRNPAQNGNIDGTGARSSASPASRRRRQPATPYTLLPLEEEEPFAADRIKVQHHLRRQL